MNFIVVEWHVTVEKYLEWVLKKINILTILINVNDQNKCKQADPHLFIHEWLDKISHLESYF